MKSVCMNMSYKKNDTDINSCIEKIQNIKAWLEELCIENTIPISSRTNASKQMKNTLMNCLEHTGYLKFSKEYV